MAVSQTASLSWDFLEDLLAEPQARRKLPLMSHSLEIQRCVLTSAEQSKLAVYPQYAIPVAGGVVKRFISHCGCFSMGRGKGTSYSWNSNSDLYKEK